MNNPFKDTTIERRCMARVKARIASAQKKYDDHTALLEREAEKEHQRIESKLESDKLTKADELVEEVFGAGAVKAI